MRGVPWREPGAARRQAGRGPGRPERPVDRAPVKGYNLTSTADPRLQSTDTEALIDYGLIILNYANYRFGQVVDSRQLA